MQVVAFGQTFGTRSMNINPVKQVAYKVVRVVDGRKYSCLSDFQANYGDWPKWRVEYQENTLVRPKSGRLFVFDTLEHAKNHVGSNPEFEIWKVEAYGAREERMVLGIWYCGVSDLEAFWQGKHLMGKEWAPYGSMSCNALRLVKRMV